jgi:Outer membrane protein beta-barrel domain
MKNTFSGLLLLVSLSAFAQDQLYIGPSLGARLSTVTFFEDRAKNDFKSLPAFGFDLGLMVERRIKGRFCLNAQLIYSQKGKIVKGTSNAVFDINSQAPDPLYQNKQTNRYIELPIYFNLEFKNNVGKSEGMAGTLKSYKWFIGGGPTISYWLGGKGKLQSSNVKEDLQMKNMAYKINFRSDSIQNLTDITKMYVTNPNRLQFAINITGGIALEPVGFQKIVIAAHLELGQTFMSKGNSGYFPGSKVDHDELKAKYHSLRFSVSYLFDTKIEKSKQGKSTIKNKGASKKKR